MVITNRIASDVRRQAEARRSRRVLVVEDEAPLRVIVRRNLEHRGIHVTEAGTVAEALAAARGDPPDLLVLDINLPDRSGWEVLRELRLSGSVPRTIVMSAARVPRDRLREFGVAAFLPKPFPIDALVRLVTSEAEA
jgi:DNA-binding response OmpR family regulator